MINTEGVKILMIHVLQRTIQDYRANKRAIKRLTTKYDLSVDLEESIEIFSKIERLKGENDAIERYIMLRLFSGRCPAAGNPAAGSSNFAHY